MLLFGKRALDRPDLIITGERLLLRPPHKQDYKAWAALREDSRAFLQPWEPTWPKDDLTLAAYRRRVSRYSAEIERDASYPFFLFATNRLDSNGQDSRGQDSRGQDSSSQELLGGLNLTNVRRGAASMASLGYWMGERHARQGLMTEAVQMVLPFAARTLGLRRIEAACVPENKVSVRLLEKTAFVQEGYARQYLAINGEWRDHLLYAHLMGPSANDLD